MTHELVGELTNNKKSLTEDQIEAAKGLLVVTENLGTMSSADRIAFVGTREQVEEYCAEHSAYFCRSIIPTAQPEPKN